MRSIPKQLFTAAAVGLLVVLPFVILEAVNTKGFSTVGFPFALFTMLWILAAAFIGLCRNIIRDLKAGTGLGLATTAILMVVIATVWSGIVFDQMPCFMGVPNCD